MQRNRFRPRPGPRAVLSAVAASATVLLGGCIYGFQGGGGFPSDVRTMYIQAFDNQTDRFQLENEIFQSLNDKLPRALGVRPGGKEVADAVVRGKILRYDDVAANYRSTDTDQPTTSGTGAQVVQNSVDITIAIQIIDVKRNEILWESQGLTGKGQYDPNTQTDQDGRKVAIDQLVQQIIDGAQSQW